MKGKPKALKLKKKKEVNSSPTHAHKYRSRDYKKTQQYRKVCFETELQDSRAAVFTYTLLPAGQAASYGEERRSLLTHLSHWITQVAVNDFVVAKLSFIHELTNLIAEMRNQVSLALLFSDHLAFL